MSGLAGAGSEDPGAGGLVMDCPGQSWGWIGLVVLDPMVAAVEVELGLALRC